MREVRWQGTAAVAPRRLWARVGHLSFLLRWPVVLAIALGPLVIGGPLGLTPDLLEFSQRGQTLAELNGRYDGLLVGYLLAMALLAWLAAILGIAWRTWSTPRPHGVRPDYRPVAAAVALWIVLAAGAMYLPVGPKSERTVILPPPAAQTDPSQSAAAR